ncbi:MAG: trigger factor [Gloeobacterales cyanobacterium]
MKVTQEKRPNSQIGLNIEVDEASTKLVYDKMVQKLMRTARIPGFRPGKAPRPIVLQYLGKDYVKAEALKEVIQRNLEQAQSQVNVPAIGEYELTDRFDALYSQFEPGKSLTFQAAVDVEPEVTLREGYENLSIKYAEVAYDPTRVDKTLEDYRKRKATSIPAADRPAQLGDIAVMDFRGKTVDDDAEIPGGSAMDFQIELQESQFIPGFVLGIVGMNVEETKEIPVRFPDDYAQEDLQGREALFTVTLKELKEQQLPDLNDDFAKEISEFETLDALKAELEKRYREEAEEATQGNRDIAIVDAILEGTTLELPATLVNREVEFLANQTFQDFQRRGIDPSVLFTEENLPQIRAQFQEEASKRLKRTLALAEVARREKLTVDQAALDVRVEELLAASPDLDRRAVVEFVQNELLTQKILDWLAEHSTIELIMESSPIPSTDANEVNDESSSDK